VIGVFFGFQLGLDGVGRDSIRAAGVFS